MNTNEKLEKPLTWDEVIEFFGYGASLSYGILPDKDPDDATRPLGSASPGFPQE